MGIDADAEGGTAPHARIMVLHSSGHRALRKGRASLPGQVYLLTTTTASRRPLFAGWDLASRTCSVLAAPATWDDARLLCWVLMPDHWHGLLQLGPRTSPPAAMNRFKALTTKTLRRCGVEGTVWARAFHDHALRREEDLRDVARYLVLNPVRAGLVRRVGDYPFWDACWL